MFSKIPVGNLQCATRQLFSCLFRHPRDSTMDIIGALRPEGLRKLSQGAQLRPEGDWDFQVGARLLQACKGSSCSAASQSTENPGWPSSWLRPTQKWLPGQAVQKTLRPHCRLVTYLDSRLTTRSVTLISFLGGAEAQTQVLLH